MAILYKCLLSYKVNKCSDYFQNTLYKNFDKASKQVAFIKPV